ncbi:ankyrin, partial [Clathrospora elynae]
ADVRDHLGQTPLMLAAHHGHGRIAKLLLDYPATIDAVNFLGHTALHYATEKSARSIVELLLSHETAKKISIIHDIYSGHYPLHVAAEKGHEMIVKMLID